jgi:hypothetical protein
MAGEPIPTDLRAFIARYIDSVAQLEALLLLRNNPTEEWRTADVARRLYVGEEELAPILARLCADGFASCRDEIYRYEVAAPELATLVDRLADAYKEQLIPITNLIHAKPRRIREFADAFKLKKDQ